MYINPFVLGLVTGVFASFIILVIASVVMAKKKK